MTETQPTPTEAIQRDLTQEYAKLSRSARRVRLLEAAKQIVTADPDAALQLQQQAKEGGRP
jgi:hypothetical protein